MAEAIEKIKAAGMQARVVCEDDEHFIVTCDYRTDRVNLSLRDSKVVRVDIG